MRPSARQSVFRLSAAHSRLLGSRRGSHRHTGSLDQQANLDEAIASGNKRRVRYYQDRLRSMTTRTPFDAMMPVVAALDAQEKEVLREGEAIDVASRGRFDGEAVVDDAIAHGVLTRHPDGTVGFGIPSFRDYMAVQLNALSAAKVAPSRAP